MKTKRKPLSVLPFVLGAAVLAAVVAATSFAFPSSSSANRSRAAAQRLIVAVVALPVTLDSMFAPGQESVEAILNLYDNLLCYEKVSDPAGFSRANVTTGEAAMQPCILSKIDVSPNGRVYTLHVRPGVKDATGTELTAEDLKYTFDREFGTKAVGSYIMGVATIPNSNAVRVLDKFTVQITLQNANPLFKRVLYVHTNGPWNASVVKQHATASDPWATSWLKLNAAGFGPYYITDFTPGVQIVFQANPNYWRGKPFFDTVVYRVISDSSQRLQLLRRGEVDIAEGLSVQQVDSVRGDPKLRIIATPKNQFIFLALHATIPPTNDRRVRQALAYALPQQEIVNTVFKGKAKPLINMTPDIVPGLKKALWPYRYDLAKAKALLKASGLGKGFRTTLLINADVPIESDVAVLIRDSFRKIGVRIDIEKKPSAAFLAAGVAGKYGLRMDYTFAVVEDIAYRSITYISRKGVLNYSQYANAAFDKALAAALRTPEGPKREALLTKLQQITARDVPQLGVVQVPTIYGMKADIKGYTWYTYNQLRFDDLSR